MHDIDRYGMHRVVEEAIEITSTGPFVHISFDMDVVDPDQAPGVGTPVRGGITYREAHLAMELVAKHGIAHVARAGRGEPGARRAQPDREPGGRAGLLGAGRPHPVKHGT